MWFLAQKILDNPISPSQSELGSTERLLSFLLQQGLLIKKKKSKSGFGDDEEDEDLPNNTLVPFISGEKRPRAQVKQSQVGFAHNNTIVSSANRPVAIVSSEGESSEVHSISSSEWLAINPNANAPSLSATSPGKLVFYEDDEDAEKSADDESDFDDDEATIQLLLQQQRSKYSSSLLQGTGSIIPMPRISHMSDITMGYNTQIQITNAVSDTYGNIWYATLGTTVNMQALRPVLSNTKFLMQVREVLGPKSSISREEIEDRAMMTLLGE